MEIVSPSRTWFEFEGKVFALSDTIPKHPDQRSDGTNAMLIRKQLHAHPLRIPLWEYKTSKSDIGNCYLSCILKIRGILN